MRDYLYFICSENKSADQLRGYRAADLRLCFRICKKHVFSCGSSYVTLAVIMLQIVCTLPYQDFDQESVNHQRSSRKVSRQNQFQSRTTPDLIDFQ